MERADSTRRLDFNVPFAETVGVFPKIPAARFPSEEWANDGVSGESWAVPASLLDNNRHAQGNHSLQDLFLLS